mgnify:CR=1 FL=1|jgi:hypothetical protein
MSIHIQKFIERVQGFEARATKDFSMPMKDAKDLHADITKLLLTLNNLREVAVQQSNKITVEVKGGSF